MNPGAAAALSRQRLINGIKLLETLCIAIVTPLSSQQGGAGMPLKSNVSKWRLHLQAAVLSLHSNLCALANTLTRHICISCRQSWFLSWQCVPASSPMIISPVEFKQRQQQQHRIEKWKLTNGAWLRFAGRIFLHKCCFVLCSPFNLLLRNDQITLSQTSVHWWTLTSRMWNGIALQRSLLLFFFFSF